jgi:hypothetical protein
MFALPAVFARGSTLSTSDLFSRNPLAQYGTWTPYAGHTATILAATLLIVAGLLAYIGSRLHGSIGLERPRGVVSVLLVLMWWLSLATFSVAAVTYMRALFGQYGHFASPHSPMSPVTFLSGVVTFITIAYLTRHHGIGIAIESAIVGCVAAPMIFEMPFDIIVMFKLYPPVSAQTMLLFFLPVFLLELSSFSLLTLSPAMKVTNIALFSLAAMFLAFSAWALIGFSYPSSRGPFTLNAVSKVLSFATAIALFLPERPDDVSVRS